jgi:hypothetical protein
LARRGRVRSARCAGHPGRGRCDGACAEASWGTPDAGGVYSTAASRCRCTCAAEHSGAAHFKKYCVHTIEDAAQAASCAQERKMREISLMAATALVTALLTAWGMYTVGTGMPAASKAAPASMSVLQMMRDAKNLPEQRYDAF